jgi:hypothetical protein
VPLDKNIDKEDANKIIKSDKTATGSTVSYARGMVLHIVLLRKLLTSEL